MSAAYDIIDDDGGNDRRCGEGSTPSSQLSRLLRDALEIVGRRSLEEAVFCELWTLKYDLPCGHVGLVRSPDAYWIHPAFSGECGKGAGCDAFRLYGRERNGGDGNDDDDDDRTAETSGGSVEDDEGDGPPPRAPPTCGIGVGLVGTLFSECSPSRVSWRQMSYLALDPFFIDREDGQLSKIKGGGLADWAGGAYIRCGDGLGVLVVAFQADADNWTLQSKENTSFLNEMAGLVGEIWGHFLGADAKEETEEWNIIIAELRSKVEVCVVPPPFPDGSTTPSRLTRGLTKITKFINKK